MPKGLPDRESGTEVSNGLVLITENHRGGLLLYVEIGVRFFPDCELVEKFFLS